MALSLGNAVHSLGSGSGGVATISTIGSSGVLVFVATINNDIQQTPTASSTTLGSWALRAYQEATGANFASISLFTAPFSSTLTSEMVTYAIGAGGPVGVATFDLFEINGCALSSYFDPHSGLPITGAYPLSITTSNADDFIMSAYRGGTGSDTAGAGWNLISGADFQLVQYKIVSSPQSGLSATAGTAEDVGILDAIVSSGGGGGGGGGLLLFGGSIMCGWTPPSLPFLGAAAAWKAGQAVRRNATLSRRALIGKK